MRDKTNAMRNYARLMAFIWLCSVVASLAGCSLDRLNEEPTGWSFPGKLPVDRGTVVIKNASNTTEKSWKQETRKIAKAWELQQKRKKITRVSVKKGRSTAKDSRPQTFAPATMRTPPPAQPVQPQAADLRSASSKAQSLQLRLRSIWPEAPPSGAFSR
jgi:hypothetical protein